METNNRKLKDYIKLFFSGFLMGSSDIVPGVSGGTMAFIVGIYEELINSIKAVNKEFITKVLRFKFVQIYQTFPWRFLLAVGTGIFTAILTFSHTIEWMLTNKPIQTWSFFLGLILASTYVVSKRVKTWDIKCGAMLGLGVLVAYIIVGLTPATTPNTLLYTFLAGAIAICAMILPGISGSFILVILGKYQTILGAVNDRDFITLGVFMLGAAIGIVTFAQILGYLFKKYHDLTVAILTGFMIGSIRKIWPYKQTLETTIDRHGEVVPLVQKNIMPIIDTTFYMGVITLIVGIAVVIFVEKLSQSKNS